MKDMTPEEARAEAVRRWGAGAVIEFHRPRLAMDRRGRLARYPCVVGNGVGSGLDAIQGQGHTWREAFEDARRRWTSER